MTPVDQGGTCADPARSHRGSRPSGDARMSVEEHFATIADRILAAVVTGQPVRDPQEGDPMPAAENVLAEARRHHAAVCRGCDPDVTDQQIDFYWASLGPAGQGGFLRTAEQQLNEGATR